MRQNGERVVLNEVRRFNGAMAVLDGHVGSKRQAEQRHCGPGDRVVSGPVVLPSRRVLHAESVVFIRADGTTHETTYAIETNGDRS